MQQSNKSTRREFIRNSVAAAVAVGTMTSTSNAKTDKPSPKPVWTIACRDANLHATGLPDTFKAMAAIGVEGIEASVDLKGTCAGLFGFKKPFSITTPDDVKALGQAFAQHERKISAFCLHNHFDEQPDQELACIKMTTAAAVMLDVPAIRIDIVPRKTKDENEFLKFSIQMGKRIIDATEETRIRFGVENHGGTTNKPEFLRALFDGVGSKRFGLTLDTANFYWFGHPLSRLYDIYTEFAPATCHTHCKSINYPEAEREKQRQMGWEYARYNCSIDKGDIDFKRIASILRKADYTGDLCIENESLQKLPKDQVIETLRREARLLREIAEITCQTT